MASSSNSAILEPSANGLIQDNSVVPPHVDTNKEMDIEKGGEGKAPPSKPVMIIKGNRVPFVNLFKNNIMAKVDYQPEYMDTGTDMLGFGYEDIDSIEDTY